ncbi:hypothetical protein HZS55_09255 [Halosimplex rubrum]|uniref:Uncharacterized protein n=1 Tax=Halosimplex rubrum TaxID=869889 RepID=A0A7D5SXR9_9EURY|nr:hypothetical protein [Halosimplex rubrum]QLH77471.1 hypothetical protein HZS55_09255 [Halosimplex rubrum]
MTVESDISDPGSLRAFSILPNTDSDEAFCARHGREMRSIDPVIHRDGALYTTAEDFSVYTCNRCLAEIGERAGVKPVDLYRGHLIDAFETWDQNEAPGEWFRYLCEGTPDDLDGDDRIIRFDEVTEGGEGA